MDTISLVFGLVLEVGFLISLTKLGNTASANHSLAATTPEDCSMNNKLNRLHPASLLPVTASHEENDDSSSDCLWV